MKRLSKENSSYLRHSADQKVKWYPWSEDAFNLARKEDKPLFLSSGAVWCHWCHVMAKECFYDEEISRILNDNFISIKLDRDERPDIDRRYQIAVSAMGSAGGWPLSVFLTPDKKPFFGGTYFPPEDMPGRPGLKKVLNAVVNLYKTNRHEVNDYAAKLADAIKPVRAESGAIDTGLIDIAVRNIMSNFDPKNGGFGDAPKFPMPGAIEFLSNRLYITEDKSIEVIVKKTLKAMSGGGFYDQIGGGFHRYSTDKAWIIPHFEKMADDNAWLLRNYLHAFAFTGDNDFKKTAEETGRFILSVLSDPDGGFYTSQDADVTPDDEGGYFTWTDRDFRKVLDKGEYEIMSLHLLNDAGSMHHDNSKKVLFITSETGKIADELNMAENEVIARIKSAKTKLLKARSNRPAPFIDRVFYASVNGMMISSFITGYRILQNKDLLDFALKSLKRILEELFIKDTLYHVKGVKALLDDYAHIADGLVSAYEVTGQKSYLGKAEKIMHLCIERLWDNNYGGFFDTDEHLLDMGLKGIEDIPNPSANAICIRNLIKLSLITGNESYLKYAEKALAFFSSSAKDISLHAGYYFSVLDFYLNRCCLKIGLKPQSSLAKAAVHAFHPFTVLAYGKANGHIVPCVKDTCYEPIKSIDALEIFLKNKAIIS